ncbi:UPF0175 family protein [Caldilinea sp.]|jgi:predicted HTH domain antitoxin|uniref:UPF0175 family protein n=1 Tax=Caldilinea sp. TaxID=2293560 RepID=UPI0021DC3F8A|nr:UPF0175 family protein [Caldilinea sp.]GIV70510.1 MAG: hypothetical protein KatS3mg048_3372 [Caldilinea sp.]
MSATISVQVPREILHAARLTVDELKQELALALYQQGRLSFGKASEIAGISVWDFQMLLGARKIPVHYDLQDYEDDLATLHALRRHDDCQ